MHVLRFIAPRLEAVATVRCGSPGSCLETDMQDYSCIHESSLGGSHFVVARHAVFQTCCQCLLLQEPCETHTCSHKKPGTTISTGTKVSPATAFSPAFSLLPQCRTVRPAHACAHHFIHFLRSCRCYICWLVTDTGAYHKLLSVRVHHALMQVRQVWQQPMCTNITRAWIVDSLKEYC